MNYLAIRSIHLQTVLFGIAKKVLQPTTAVEVSVEPISAKQSNM